MFRKNQFARVCLTSSAVFGLIVSAALAAYVTPKIGGGQSSAMMKHADVSFDGVNITVHLDTTVPTPVLRPLTPPDQFDPNQPWSVLGYQAYNYQWAWNPGTVAGLPDGTAICMERVYQDPELTVYLRTPMYDPNTYGPKWPEIFTENGYRWKWSGAMQHNAYAICGPEKSSYTATYKIYIGDVVTKEPLEGYSYDMATFTWNATPAGDMNCDGFLDGLDIEAFCLALMDRAAYEAEYTTCRWYNADCNCDGAVGVADIQAFTARVLGM
ncbi:MAG TPA: hypothetical protein VMV94_13375 [Phycisphaerae bacterium]|nr:hypothetical protein [Phycisphaerae bacterium]